MLYSPSHIMHMGVLSLLLLISLISITLADQSIYSERCREKLYLEKMLTDQIVIYPVQIINNTKQMYLNAFNSSSQTWATNLSIAFTMDGNEYVMKLKRNGGIIKAYTNTDNYLHSFRPQQNIKRLAECFYQGYFDNSASAHEFALVSICDGLRGVLKVSGQSYLITPYSKADGSSMLCPHIMKKLVFSPIGKCSSRSDGFSDLKQLHRTEYYKHLTMSSQPHNLVKRNLASKTIKYAIITDSYVLSQFLDQASMLSYLLQVTNIVDMYYQRLNIRVSLGYHNVLTQKEELFITSNPKETIQNFLKYSKAIYQTQKYDVLHLISGRLFDGKSQGMAIPSSICTDRSIAVVSAASVFNNSMQLAGLLAHMIGHNIGLDHDTPNCLCDDINGSCIMDDFKNDCYPSTFSSCSLDQMMLLNRIKYGNCLEDKPISDNYPQKCGNGVIERGEQCDCGSSSNCEHIDPCCDASTCLLKSWATCRTGPCCDNCIARTSKHMCRPSVDDCDEPESCDGFSGECPDDQKIEDGQPCNNGAGYCYQGLCPVKHQQCKLIFGDKAISENDKCYRSKNIEGNELGHCGENPMGGFKQCNNFDAVCGLLHCERSGKNIPEDGPNREIICLNESISISIHDYNKGIVQDGTKCYDGHLCLNSVCTPISQLYTVGCPISSLNNVTCSGHGRCTTSGKCSCYDGFGGELCDQEVPLKADWVTTQESVPSLTAENKSELRRGYTSIIVGCVVGVLIIIALVSVAIFCYRKKELTHHIYKKQNRMTKEIMALQEQSIAEHCQIKKRYYRKRKFSKAYSSEESCESDTDFQVPEVIHDILNPAELSRQPQKGILKKPRTEDVECANSECSCDYSCSCSACEQENLSLFEAKSDTDNQEITPSDSEVMKYSFAAGAGRSCLGPDSLYEIHNPADSATDSAIDMPFGDSSVSTLNESAGTCHVPCYQIPNYTPKTLQTIPASNTSSSNTIAESNDFSSIKAKILNTIQNQRDYVSPSDHHSSIDSLYEQTRIPQPGLSEDYDECLESNSNKHYSPKVIIMPNPGPIRTFRPIHGPNIHS